MEPATHVRIVLFNLERKFLADNLNAVQNDNFDFFSITFSSFLTINSFSNTGLESAVILPSNNFTILEEYFLAISLNLMLPLVHRQAKYLDY